MLVKTKKIVDNKVEGYEAKLHIVIDEQNCLNISCKEDRYDICLLKAYLDEDNSFQLIDVWVDKSYQKQGLGSALMKAIDYVAYENGVDKIEGYFTPGNNRAKPMYQHYGYDVIDDNGDLKIVKDGGKDGENFTKYNSDIIEEEYDQIMLDEVVM